MGLKEKDNKSEDERKEKRNKKEVEGKVLTTDERHLTREENDKVLIEEDEQIVMDKMKKDLIIIKISTEYNLVGLTTWEGKKKCHKEMDHQINSFSLFFFSWILFRRIHSATS